MQVKTEVTTIALLIFAFTANALGLLRVITIYPYTR
jgi:hypothetical protein